MVILGLSRDKQTLTVKIGGKNFLDLKDVLVDNHFYFQPEFEYQEKVWIKEVYLCEDALLELYDIEEFTISDSILDALEPTPETEFFRLPFDESQLRSKPIGDFQIRAIKQGITQSRLYLAHKMGLGKSFMIISILNHLWAKGLIDKILIVAPTESVINFKRELLRFSTIPLSNNEICIAGVENREPFRSDVKVVIMRYRTFLMLSDDAYKKTHHKFTKKYRTACLPLDNWGMNRAIVLDEAHLIKNSQSRWTKTLHMHKHFFRFRYMLSGTPYPRGVEDLYSQITFLDKGLIPVDYHSWISSLAVLGNNWSQYAIRYYKEDRVKNFLRGVEKWLIREFTEDNIDLPERIIDPVYVEFSEKQKRIYQSYISYRLDESKSKNGKIVMKEVFNDFPRLSLALDNPSILKGKVDFQKNPVLYKLIDKWKFEDHSKLEATESLLEKFIDEEEKKVIIWSGHPLTIKQLGEHFKKYDPVLIHGGLETPKGLDRNDLIDQLVESFKKEKKHRLLIASYYMIARAVNIVEAPRAICFDRPYDFEIWDQMTKRNHRYGSTETVLIKPLLIENSIDERQDRVLKTREKIDKDLLKYDSLSKEQWKKLFEGEEL